MSHVDCNFSNEEIPVLIVESRVKNNLAEVDIPGIVWARL